VEVVVDKEDWVVVVEVEVVVSDGNVSNSVDLPIDLNTSMRSVPIGHN
jgi:hypothetical protein